ncbi:MAG TPA: DUF190 domain-containing protein [Terriglobia bacterium]|nr:DUF190 domain-containing protein [Terriglobia bacterium]
MEHMEHERFEGDRTLMRIHIGEDHKYQGKALYHAIIELLRHEGFYGATVLRGVAGFGGHHHYHTGNILRLAYDLPIIIEVIDYAERIQKVIPRLDEMTDSGVITLEKVHVILYRRHETAAATDVKSK